MHFQRNRVASLILRPLYLQLVKIKILFMPFPSEKQNFISWLSLIIFPSEDQSTLEIWQGMNDRRQFNFDVDLFKGSLGVQEVQVLPPLRVVPHIWVAAEDHEQVVVHYEGAVVVPFLTKVW